MKTFTATHLNKHAQEVFDEVKEYGSAVIEHDRYRGGVFAIVWNRDHSKEEIERVLINDQPKYSIGHKFNKDGEVWVCTSYSEDGYPLFTMEDK